MAKGIFATGQRSVEHKVRQLVAQIHGVATTGLEHCTRKSQATYLIQSQRKARKRMVAMLGGTDPNMVHDELLELLEAVSKFAANVRFNAA